MPKGLTKRRPRTRARLLEAALAVFAERGFHGTSIEDICQQAGFTRGAFYSNFASKDELFLALFDAHTEQVLDRLRDIDLPEGVDSCAGAAANSGMWLSTMKPVADSAAWTSGDATHSRRGHAGPIVKLGNQLGDPAGTTRFSIVIGRRGAPVVACVGACRVVWSSACQAMAALAQGASGRAGPANAVAVRAAPVGGQGALHGARLG